MTAMTEQEMLELEERQRGRKRKTDGNYASEYYDPDKAHEYYMKHRKLAAIKNGTSKKKSSTKKKSSSKKSTKKSTKKTSTKDTKQKQILQQAKDAIDNNIANLKDIVSDWEDQQQAAIDELDTTGKSKEEKTKITAQKAAIRKRIRAVKREMNKQIRAARALYRQYKSAYTAGSIEKFAADQAAAAQKSQGESNGTDDKKD